MKTWLPVISATNHFYSWITPFNTWHKQAPYGPHQAIKFHLKTPVRNQQLVHKCRIMAKAIGKLQATNASRTCVWNCEQTRQIRWLCKYNFRWRGAALKKNWASEAIWPADCARNCLGFESFHMQLLSLKRGWKVSKAQHEDEMYLKPSMSLNEASTFTRMLQLTNLHNTTNPPAYQHTTSGSSQKNVILFHRLPMKLGWGNQCHSNLVHLTIKKKYRNIYMF